MNVFGNYVHSVDHFLVVLVLVIVVVVPFVIALTLRGFLFAELTRGYLSQPSQDESDSFAERRERVYTFMKTPRELEKVRRGTSSISTGGILIVRLWLNSNTI